MGTPRTLHFGSLFPLAVHPRPLPQGARANNGFQGKSWGTHFSQARSNFRPPCLRALRVKFPGSFSQNGSLHACTLLTWQAFRRFSEHRYWSSTLNMPNMQPRPQGFSHFLRDKPWGRGCPNMYTNADKWETTCNKVAKAETISVRLTDTFNPFLRSFSSGALGFRYLSRHSF